MDKILLLQALIMIAGLVIILIVVGVSHTGCK